MTGPGATKGRPKGIVGGWWDRLRGRLEPTPCPYSLAGALDMPLRRFVAGPQHVLAAFNLGAGERALEIGPGTGYYSVEAATRVGASGRLICLDLQREMLSECRRRVQAAGHSADFLQADALALPLRSRSLDHVLLVGVLGEFPNREHGLEEIRRALRPNGRLSVSEQMPDPDFITRGTLRRELGAAGFVEDTMRGWLWYTSTWHLAS